MIEADKRTALANLDKIDVDFSYPMQYKKIQLDALNDIKYQELIVSQYLYRVKILDAPSGDEPVDHIYSSIITSVNAETDALNNASNHQALFEHFRKKVFARYGLKGEVSDAQIDSLDIESKEKTKLKNLLDSGSFYDFACKEGMCEPYSSSVIEYDEMGKEEKLMFERLYKARINSGYAMSYYMQHALNDETIPTPNFNYFDNSEAQLSSIAGHITGMGDEITSEYIGALYTMQGKKNAAEYMMQVMKMTPLYVDLSYHQAESISKSGSGDAWNQQVSWVYGNGPYVATPDNYALFEKKRDAKFKENPDDYNFQAFLNHNVGQSCLNYYISQERMVKFGEILPTFVQKYRGTRMEAGEATLSGIIYGQSTKEPVRLVDTENSMNISINATRKDINENGLTAMVAGCVYDRAIHPVIAANLAKFGIKIGGGAASFGVSFLVGLGIDACLLEKSKGNTDILRNYITNQYVPQMKRRTSKLKKENETFEGKQDSFKREQLIKALEFMKESLETNLSLGRALDAEQQQLLEFTTLAIEDLKNGTNDFQSYVNLFTPKLTIEQAEEDGKALLDAVIGVNNALPGLYCEEIKNRLYVTALTYYETHKTLQSEKENAEISVVPNSRRDDRAKAREQNRGEEHRDKSLFSVTEQEAVLSTEERLNVLRQGGYLFQPAVGKADDKIVDRVKKEPQPKSDTYKTYRSEIMKALTEGRSLKTTESMVLYATPHYQEINSPIQKYTDGLFGKFTAKVASRDSEGKSNIPKTGVYRDIKGPINNYYEMPGVDLTTDRQKEYYEFLQTIRSASRSYQMLDGIYKITELFPDRKKRLDTATEPSERVAMADIFRAERSVIEDILFIYKDAFDARTSQYQTTDFIEFCKKDPFLKNYVTPDGKIDTKALFSFEQEDQTKRYDATYQMHRTNEYEERCINLLKSIETYRDRRVSQLAFERLSLEEGCKRINTMVDEKIEKLLGETKSKVKVVATDFYKVAILDYFSVSEEKRQEYLKEFGIKVDPIQFFASKHIDLKDAFKKAQEGDFSSFEADEFKKACDEYSKTIDASKLNQERVAPSSENSNKTSAPEEQTAKKELSREQDKILDDCFEGLIDAAPTMWNQAVEGVPYGTKMALGAGGWIVSTKVLRFLSGQAVFKTNPKKLKKVIEGMRNLSPHGKISQSALARILHEQAGLSEAQAKKLSKEVFKKAGEDLRSPNIIKKCGTHVTAGFFNKINAIRADKTLTLAQRAEKIDKLCREYGFSNYDRRTFVSLHMKAQDKFVPEHFEIFEVKAPSGVIKRCWRFTSKAIIPLGVGFLVAENWHKDKYIVPEEKVSQIVDATGLSTDDVKAYFSEDTMMKSCYMLDLLLENKKISEDDWIKYRSYLMDDVPSNPEFQCEMRRVLKEGYDALERTGFFISSENTDQRRGATAVLEEFKMPMEGQSEYTPSLLATRGGIRLS